MPTNKRLWAAIAAALILCGGAAWGIFYYRSRVIDSPRAMLHRVPVHDAVVVYIDFAALRQSGILQMVAGSKAAQESDYLDFVRKSGFDYTRDLDAALVAFRPAGKFFVLKGRFDWPRLNSYAKEQQGACAGGLCRMRGSAPDRNISFRRLRREVMALAVASDDSAALQITATPQEQAFTIDVPTAPVWLALPPAALRTAADLPAGTRMFARALQNADGVVFSLVPYRSAFAAKLDVRCRSAEDAAALAGELQRGTKMLRDLIEREHQKPNPMDFSGVLTSGSFRVEGNRVFGFWPIQRGFLENVLGGTA